MNIVGTPWTAVQRSLVIVSRTAWGEKVSTGTIVEPWVTQAIVPRTQPKQWKNGTGMHIRSFGVRFMQSPMFAPLATRFRCRSIAPLGNPVVPEVYMMQMTSSGSQEASSASSALMEVSSAFAFISSQFSIHEYRFSPMYTTFRRCGNFSERIRPPVASRTSGHDFKQRPGIADVLEPVGEDQQLRVALPEDVFELEGPVLRVYGDEDRSDPRRGELEDQPFRDVRRPDADVVPLPDPQGHEPARDRAALLAELPVVQAQVAVHVHHGVGFRVTGGDFVESCPMVIFLKSNFVSDSARFKCMSIKRLRYPKRPRYRSQTRNRRECAADFPNVFRGSSDKQDFGAGPDFHSLASCHPPGATSAFASRGPHVPSSYSYSGRSVFRAGSMMRQASST